MTAWTDEELGRIGEAQELQLASERPDGTLRPYVTMWVVRVDDELYVRSAYGANNPWFRRAKASGVGRIRAGGAERDVTVAEPASDVHSDIDATYRGEVRPVRPRHRRNRRGISRPRGDDQARAAFDGLVMDAQPDEREQRVTPLELFFDLVVVFAFTQVTELMSDDLTWPGIGRGLLILAAIWWAWTGYAWLTNALEPEEGRVRAGMFGAMAAMLVVALAVPGAFGADAVLFGVAYLLVRLLNLVLYAIAGRRDPDLLRALIGFAPAATIGPACILLAGFVDVGAQTALWGVGLAVLYGGALIGRGRGWHISPTHFAERYGLIVIIALGESIIALGVGAAGFSLSAGIISAAVLGVVVVASLWWAYFDVVAVMSQRQLAQTTGAARARLARDYYSYLHEPMIAGIVLFALGLKTTIEHVGEPLAAVPAVALCGGLALYFLTHVGLRVRLVRFIRRTTTERPGWIGPGRLATGIAMLALIPAVLELPALASLTLLTAVCCALIAWDVIHYREHRAEVRRARP
jgi:low temperature requirement protein LtrA